MQRSQRSQTNFAQREEVPKLQTQSRSTSQISILYSHGIYGFIQYLQYVQIHMNNTEQI
jgi:hypothetical protein